MRTGKALPVPDNIRKQIHEEPERFCEILKSINMSPDIFSLHNWSTWLTPLGLKVGGKCEGGLLIFDNQ